MGKLCPMHTPHLLLLLDIRILDAQRHRLVLQVLPQADEFRNIKSQFPCEKKKKKTSLVSYVRPAVQVDLHSGGSAEPPPLRPRANENSPNGPLTVILLFTVGLYDVLDLNFFKSPIDNSTPGGMVIGVRPSFEGRFVVVENCLCANVGHAGTSNPGRAEPEDEPKACPSTLHRRGMVFEAIESCPCCRNGWDVFRCTDCD